MISYFIRITPNVNSFNPITTQCTEFMTLCKTKNLNLIYGIDETNNDNIHAHLLLQTDLKIQAVRNMINKHFTLPVGNAGKSIKIASSDELERVYQYICKPSHSSTDSNFHTNTELGNFRSNYIEEQNQFSSSQNITNTLDNIFKEIKKHPEIIKEILEKIHYYWSHEHMFIPKAYIQFVLNWYKERNKLFPNKWYMRALFMTHLNWFKDMDSKKLSRSADDYIYAFYSQN